jgi:hypothetical protein
VSYHSTPSSIVLVLTTRAALDGKIYSNDATTF